MGDYQCLSPGAKSPSTVTMEYNYVSLPPVVCTVVDDDRLSPYANLPSNVTMENMFLYRKPNSNHRKGSGGMLPIELLRNDVKYLASSSYHLTRLVFMKRFSSRTFTAFLTHFLR